MCVLCVRGVKERLQPILQRAEGVHGGRSQTRLRERVGPTLAWLDRRREEPLQFALRDGMHANIEYADTAGQLGPKVDHMHDLADEERLRAEDEGISFGESFMSVEIHGKMTLKKKITAY